LEGPPTLRAMMTTCMSAPAAAQCRTCQTSRGSSQLTSPPPLITTSIHTIEDDDALSVLLLGQGLGCAVPFFMHLFCTWYEQWPASLLLSSPIHFCVLSVYPILLPVCRRGLLYHSLTAQGLKQTGANARTTSLSQIPKEPRAVTPYYDTSHE